MKKIFRLFLFTALTALCLCSIASAEGDFTIENSILAEYAETSVEVDYSVTNIRFSNAGDLKFDLPDVENANELVYEVSFADNTGEWVYVGRYWEDDNGF